ncbi:DUF6893 family small protein [Sinomonas terrae]
MKTVGVMTTVLGALAGVALLVVGVRSIPDIMRYLKIRQL